MRIPFIQTVVCIVALSLMLAPVLRAEKPGCGCGSKVLTRESTRLPKAVRTYLAENLAGYEVVGEADYEEKWLDDPDLHWSLQADFDGNGKLDFALLMKKEKSIVLVVVRRVEHGYAHEVLEKDLCDIPVIATLRIQPKGHTNLAAPDAPATNMKYFRNPAIRLGILETSIDFRWYWEEGNWHAV